MVRCRKLILNFAFLLLTFSSCSINKRISREAHHSLIDTRDLVSAHIGISIFDSSSNKYLYNYQSDKYFIPSSNVKLFTLYAGLKYLGDSLVAARVADNEGTVSISSYLFRRFNRWQPA